MTAQQDIPQLLEQLYQALNQPDELLDDDFPAVGALTAAIQAHLDQATPQQLAAEQQESWSSCAMCWGSWSTRPTRTANR